jgi:hypothetical protein
VTDTTTPDLTVAIAMAEAIFETIATFADPRVEEGFSDVMAALTVVNVGVLATGAADGDGAAYVAGSTLLAGLVLDGLTTTDARRHAVSMIRDKREAN